MRCHKQACRHGIRLFAVALLAIAGSGCASIDWGAIRGDDVAARRKQRLIQAAERFDMHRDEAQWQAAQARLRHGDLYSARNQLETLLARNPDHADARAMLSQIDNSETPVDWAGVDLAPVDLAVESAVDALQSNQPEAALDVLRPALSRFPDSAALWRTLGAAHHQRGDFQAAQSALRQALSLDNSSPLAYFLLGQSLQRLGHDEQARRCFGAAADLDGRYAR
ncbi:MAG: tetratricopeptide repeat protein [Planctomycetes bacterium]|nr:tetratricopeptide repeat protein [Planctomycetota bacterium]